MSCWIYALVDPAGEIRYIGKTVKKHLSDRLAHHVCLALKKGDDSYRSRWIRSLSERPKIIPLAIVERTEGAATEIRAIKVFRESGARLVNTTDGGDGNLGWSPTAEQRKNMSLARRKWKTSPEHLQKMISSNVGRKATSEHKAKLSEWMKVRPVTDTFRENCRQAALRRWKEKPESWRKAA